MRVMIDTNVLVSALLFPSNQMNMLFYKITTEHQLPFFIVPLQNTVELKVYC